MLNKVIMMGRLTAEPELRQTQNGTSVSSFSLAVERSYARNGERETDFFNVVAWQARAEFVVKYFRKGQLICVEGRLQRRAYQDRDGNNRHAYEIIAEATHFAGYNKSESHNGTMPADFDPNAASDDQMPAMYGTEDDDLPF